ncbi:MAG: saccharopine dehydrogenase NADP-binding domain-containing protein [Algicola sp.]|nr:saccharopine dehydrogenase NADP-binding domain-containing protein [Algicola sp.]
MKTVLVLGGYGNFGKRIVENLCDIEQLNIVVAGRSSVKANQLISQLQGSSNTKATLSGAVIDIFSAGFAQQLKQISPFLVIHTSGPFQGQDYRVPEACIQAGAHYIDLADDRRFVCDIGQLDAKAKSSGVTVVSGASSVPGLASAVIEQYLLQFSSITAIDLAIAPGNKAERGLATVKAILSYTGHPFAVFRAGQWQDAYGWMDSTVFDFGGIVGKRYLANVDVPDLELFPARYNVSDRVSFQAGLELPFLHLSMVVMAYLSKVGLVKNWAGLSKPIVGASNVFLPFGTDKGAMSVRINGFDKVGKDKTVNWTLYAPKGNGPYIPTLSTIILARKLIDNSSVDTGAKPCVGLFTLVDIEPYFDHLDIYYTEHFTEEAQG